MERRVVITGMGAITPLGNDLQTTWQGVTSGCSGIGQITIFDASTFPVRIAAEVKNFTPDLSALPADLRLLAGRSSQLGLHAAGMAIQDAGIDLARTDRRRIGVALGGDEEYLRFGMLAQIYAPAYTYRAFAEGQDAYIEMLAHSPRLGKVWSLRKKTDIGSKAISLVYNLQGPLESSHTACSSSGHAIGKAKRLIEQDDCDVVIAGGHCSMVSEFSVAGF